MSLLEKFITKNLGPGWFAQLVRALSCNARVVGLNPSQDTYKNQPMNVSLNGTTNQYYSLSLSKITKKGRKELVGC